MRFVISSRLMEVRRALDLAAEFCAGHALAERDANAIGVVLDEVLNNIIHHGLSDSEAHEIAVSLNYSNGEISVEIEDDAAPFDPTQVPAPQFAANVTQRKLGGLGLVFVRALTDSMVHRRSAERNILVLRRRAMDRAPLAQPYPACRWFDCAYGAGRLVAVEGRLDSEAARGLRDHLLTLIRDGSVRLAVNLTRLAYMGSAGIWVLLAAEELAASLGGGLVVFGLSPETGRLFERMGIADALHLCNTPEEALRTLKPLTSH